jgi:hypothetical protein
MNRCRFSMSTIQYVAISEDKKDYIIAGLHFFDGIKDLLKNLHFEDQFSTS